MRSSREKVASFLKAINKNGRCEINDKVCHEGDSDSNESDSVEIVSEASTASCITLSSQLQYFK